MNSKPNVSRSYSTKETTSSKSDTFGFLNNITSAFRSSSLSASTADDVETIDPDTQSENQGLLSKYSQKLKTAVNAGAFINKSKNLVQGATESMQHSLNFTKYMPYIIMLCLGGAFFLFLACTLAPVILIAPQKFSSCFALSSLCFLGAIALVRGPQKFLLSLIAKEKLLYTGTYVCSVIGTFMFSKVPGAHFLAIIFAALQAISLLWLIAASVPGGKKVAGIVQSMVIRCCTGCWKKMLGMGGDAGNGNKSFLPI